MELIRLLAVAQETTQYLAPLPQQAVAAVGRILLHIPQALAKVARAVQAVAERWPIVQLQVQQAAQEIRHLFRHHKAIAVATAHIPRLTLVAAVAVVRQPLVRV